MPKLKERQFYNVRTRKREMVPEDYIEIVKFKNGNYALLGISRDNDKMFKLFSETKLDKMEKIYGKAKRYRRN